MKMNDNVVLPLLIVGLIYFIGFLFGLGYFTASMFFRHKTILHGSLNIGTSEAEEEQYSAWRGPQKED